MGSLQRVCSPDAIVSQNERIRLYKDPFLTFSRIIFITILTYPRSSHMGPDWIQSLWTRHHCTLDDPSYNQFRETLNLLRNEHDLEQGRNLALNAAKLILLAKKVNPIYSHSISSVQY